MDNITNSNKSKPKQWTCEDCNKTMTANYKDKHLETLIHKRKNEKITKWTCNYCDKTMPSRNKTNHERSLKHKEKVKCSTCSESEE